MKTGEIVREEMEFEILGEMGRGNYGVVYKGVQKGVDRVVAIKELHNPESSLPLLKKEAWINGSMIHPNIVSVLLFDEKRGLIVMEHAPNSLSRRIQGYNDRRQRFDEGQVVDILTQCLEALSYAYDHGCRFHGDLKPGNILITEDGTVKISDFGVSISYKTAPSPLSGSETWAAPEVLKCWNESRVWTGDQKSDLFSLGIIAFLLLTGSNPFIDPAGLKKTSELIIDLDYVPKVPPTTDPSIGRIVSRLLAKETGKRFQSAREALDDIYGLAEQPPVELPQVPQVAPVVEEPAISPAYSSEELQRLAYQRNQERDYESGEKYSTIAIKKNPKNLYAYQTRGFARSNLERFPEAVSDFTTAIKLCPSQDTTKLGQLYYHRAFAESMKGERDKACEDVRQALQYDPTNSKYRYFRSRFCKD